MKYQLDPCGFPQCGPCLRYATYEKPELNRVRQYLQDRFRNGPALSGNFCDIGAHVGLWSLHLEEWYEAHSMAIKVLAFEPDPSNYAILCRNLRPDANKVAVCAGCYDMNGKVAFKHTGHFGGHHIAGVEQGDSEIEVVKLDTMYGTPPQFDVIKIDTEGAESQVIDGAIHTLLAQEHCLLVCEYSVPQLARFASTARQLTKHICDCGFVIATQREEQLIHDIKVGQLWRIFFVKG